MLTLIPDLPATVVGVEAHGKVTAEDYVKVLIPAVEAAEAASSDRKVRVLYVLGPEFPQFTAGAVWEDTKLGLGRLRHWERIAVVGDAVWVRRAIRGLGWAMPGEIRVYASDTLNDARLWVTSPLDVKPVSGGRRFFGDAIIAFRVLNEARHRLVGAVFGVQRDWRANLVTVIAIASAVDAIHRAVAAPGAQVRKVRSSPTLVGDSLIAAGVAARSNQQGHDTSGQGHGLRRGVDRVRRRGELNPPDDSEVTPRDPGGNPAAPSSRSAKSGTRSGGTGLRSSGPRPRMTFLAAPPARAVAKGGTQINRPQLVGILPWTTAPIAAASRRSGCLAVVCGQDAVAGELGEDRQVRTAVLQTFIRIG